MSDKPLTVHERHAEGVPPSGYLRTMKGRWHPKEVRCTVCRCRMARVSMSKDVKDYSISKNGFVQTNTGMCVLCKMRQRDGRGQ